MWTTLCGRRRTLATAATTAATGTTFLTKDSGLPSNFTNFVKGVDANRAWFCTDKGLAYYDGVNWAVYRPSLNDGKPEMTVRDAQGKVTPVAVTTAPAHNYVLGIDFQGRRYLGRHRQGFESRNSQQHKQHQGEAPS